MVLYPNILDFFEKRFKEFLDKNINDEVKESIISEELSEAIKENVCKVIAIETNSKWSGVTYKEDLMDLKQFILDQIKSGIYPDKL